MKRIIINVLITIWIVMALFTTISLLSFNKYRVAEFGKYSVFTLDTDLLEPDFSEGSLVITKKTSQKHINVGDSVFYYNAQSDEAIVNLGTITSKEVVTSTEATFTLQNDEKLSSSYVLGKEETVKVIPVLGTILSIFQSRWGFMFTIIFPTILLLVYEIYTIALEVKKEKKNNKKEEIEELW